MFSTIAWATDGSEHSDRALSHAVRLAAESGAPLHAIHVVERLSAGRAAGQYTRLDEEELEAKIESQLRIAGATVPVRLHTTSTHTGNIAALIAELAHQAGADVIVVGTRGHGAVGGTLLGSVAQRLPHAAYCPVLVVPPAAGPAPEPAGSDAELTAAG